MTERDPYSASRIGRGVAYLVGGKAITSIAGIGTFLLLVRALPVEEFAAYTILFALVELVDAITGVGLSHVLSRYVPELFVEHKRGALRRLVAYTLALRLAVLAGFLAAIYAVAPALSPLIGLTDWEWAVKAYLAVALVRVVSTSLFTVLESMLHQAIAQLGFGSVTALRFVLLALAASQGGLDLKTVIVIELLTDVVGCGVMLIGLIRKMPRTVRGESAESSGWTRSNLGRMFDFGIKGYLQHMLILPYGGATNRLLVGGTLASAEVALFGFAHAVADIMQRYLPVKLLAGVIRPVLTARYVRDRRFSDLELAANLIFKINAIFICLAAVVIAGGGEPMLALVSDGKYSEGAVGLLLLMCALVLMYSLRQMLDHVSHALERNGPLIWSNAVITLSVLPGIALLPHLGVYALPAANVVGLMAGSLLLIHRLRIEGFDYRQDIGGLARMLAATAAGIAGSELSRWLGAGWLISLTAGVALFLSSIAALRPWNGAERRIVTEMTQRILRRRSRQTPA